MIGRHGFPAGIPGERLGTHDHGSFAFVRGLHLAAPRAARVPTTDVDVERLGGVGVGGEARHHGIGSVGDDEVQVDVRPVAMDRDEIDDFIYGANQRPRCRRISAIASSMGQARL